jgi:hypothetical protein
MSQKSLFYHDIPTASGWSATTTGSAAPPRRPPDRSGYALTTTVAVAGPYQVSPRKATLNVVFTRIT